MGRWPQYLSYQRLHLKSDKIKNIIFGSVTNFETNNDTKILTFLCKFLIPCGSAMLSWRKLSGDPPGTLQRTFNAIVRGVSGSLGGNCPETPTDLSWCSCGGSPGGSPDNFRQDNIADFFSPYYVNMQGCMVWPWCSLLQAEFTLKILIRIIGNRKIIRNLPHVWKKKSGLLF